ncbi:hypothetical protein MRX96_042363 [Rhipicephalus microplus]
MKYSPSATLLRLSSPILWFSLQRADFDVPRLSELIRGHNILVVAGSAAVISLVISQCIKSDELQGIRGQRDADVRSEVSFGVLKRPPIGGNFRGQREATFDEHSTVMRLPRRAMHL